MKKLILLACFGLFFISGTIAQEIDFTYKVDSISIESKTKYTITISITKGEGPFMVGLYENLKEDLKVIDKKDDVTTNNAVLVLYDRKLCIIYVRNTKQCAIKPLKF